MSRVGTDEDGQWEEWQRVGAALRERAPELHWAVLSALEVGSLSEESRARPTAELSPD